MTARTRQTLTVVAVAAALLTLIGLLWLWPDGDRPGLAEDYFGEQVDATVTAARLEDCSYSSPEAPVRCDVVTFEVTSGTPAGDEGAIEFPLDSGSVTLSPGDRIVVNFVPDAPPGAQFQFADFQRRVPLMWLAVLFAIAVVLLGRLRGALALGGLAASLLVLTMFVLPALLDGKPPLAVALVGSAVIGFIALYLAHGVNERTTVAVLGTFSSLAITGVLGIVFVGATNLTGLVGEDIGFLRASGGVLDFEGLLLAGIVIGALGVLDDVTVTQVSAVWELHASNPQQSTASLFGAAIRIGRDHIASTVNTLVLAYAGASLPLLLLFSEADRPFRDVINGETVAVEVVRTLVGSIGLVASVPITTLLAVLVVRGSVRGLRGDRPSGRSRPRRRAGLATANAPGPARWEDFEPRDDG